VWPVVGFETKDREMKSLALFALATVIASAGPIPKAPGGSAHLNMSCADEPRPVPETFTVFDPNAARYDVADPPTPGIEVRADGVEYTFTDQGTGEGHLCPLSTTSYYFTSTRIEKGDFPHCWRYVTEQVSGCEDPPAEDPDSFAPAPPVDPDFDEHSPNGPGEGPPGAPTVDKPAP
jgi:hypothetical protein